MCVLPIVSMPPKCFSSGKHTVLLGKAKATHMADVRPLSSVTSDMHIVVTSSWSGVAQNERFRPFL